MNKYFLLLLFLIVNQNFANSQEKLTNKIQDSVSFNDKSNLKIYQITLSESPLSIDLIEKVNGDYEGFVNLNLKQRIGSIETNFVGKTSIEKLMVKKLINKFKKKGIETIKKCEENNDCVYGLDGMDTYFKLYISGKIKEYSFWELIPNQKIGDYFFKNRNQAQSIIDYLDKKLNLKLLMHEMRMKLPKGKYSYFTGNGFAVFEIN